MKKISAVRLDNFDKLPDIRVEKLD